jgi:membrane-associated phospholipid phosphatase
MLQRPRSALLSALACLIALAACGIASHFWAQGNAWDASALKAFTKLRDNDVDGLLDRIVHLGDPLPFLLLAAAIVVAALARERRRLAVVVTGVLVAAPLTTEILKLATAQGRSHSVAFADHINNASWPSGHATGAMTLALCAVLVAPRALRPAVAVAGALYALAVGYAVIALVWHFPSDTIAAFLLSGMWALLGVAALRRWPDEVDERATARPDAGTWIVAGVLVAMSAVAISAFRPGALLDRAVSHTELVAVAGAIAAVAALVAATIVRSARSS